MSIYIQIEGEPTVFERTGDKCYDIFSRDTKGNADLDGYYGTAHYVKDSAEALMQVIGKDKNEWRKYKAIRNKHYE